MSSVVEIARAARAVLRKAFPGFGSKISVTSTYGLMLRWTDDGPTVEQVEEVLLAAGCAEAHTAWNGKRYLRTPGQHEGFYLDRYNLEQRAREQQNREQWIAEHQAERQRVEEVIAREHAARRGAWPTLRTQSSPSTENEHALGAVFETLRQRAERESSYSDDAERRPSWAPPLVLGEELAEICLELGYLTLDDKWIGRLWADFASPKRSRRWLRRHVSSLPLEGLCCRGFYFWAGTARGLRSTLLFEAQREQSGAWRFGPNERGFPYQSSRVREWEQIVREREHDRHELDQFKDRLSPERQRQLDQGIAERTRKLAVIDADDLAKAKVYHARQEMRQRALALAHRRILEFVGAPDAQMRTAARLWGCCAICSLPLSDPRSLERGIGPVCHAKRVECIRGLAAQGRPVEAIALISGMSSEFVTELLAEETVA